MNDSIVRLIDFRIQNFKNVENGVLNLINKRKNFNSSILGLYGQNGSGKTALIDALQILKILLCGQPIPDTYTDFINVKSENAKFHFHFQIYDKQKGIYEIYYDFSLKKAKSIIEPNIPVNNSNPTLKAQIYDEILTYSFTGANRKIRKSTFIDTSSERIFSPKSK